MTDAALDQLLAKAREAGPHDTSRLKFGFETRLAARIDALRPNQTALSIWSWRLVPAFAALTFIATFNMWYYANDRNLLLRNHLAHHAAEFTYLEEISGKAL